MKTCLISFIGIWLLMAGCSNAGNGDEPTCEVCELQNTKSLCEDRGCTFHATISRSILKDGKCVAFEEDVPLCIAAGDPVGNIIQAWYRDTPEGNEIITLGYGHATVDGWTDCGGAWMQNPECACGVAISVCTGQMDRATCEANYCYWAENVREAILEGEVCTGWQPETTSGCITPIEFLRFYQGGNSFKMDAAPVRYYFQSDAGVRLVEFEANPTDANFRSGNDAAPVYWNKCNGLASDPPICDCPEL